MTGDSDFVRAVARERHCFGKKVIISGAPGSVSNDLIAAADSSDPIVEAEWGAPTTSELQSKSVYQREDASTAVRLPTNVVAPTNQMPEAVSQIPVDASPVSKIEAELIKLLDYLDRNRPYLTLIFVKTHALSGTQLNLSPMQADQIFTQFKTQGILRDEVRDRDGHTLRILYFVRDHPTVQRVLHTDAR